MPNLLLLAASCVALELRPLPSTGITRLHRYYQPLRHSVSAGLSLTGYRLILMLDHVTELPVLHRRPSCMHAIANIPAEHPGAFIARFPGHASLPRTDNRVGFRITLFGTCSAFTRVTACILAKSPKVTLYTEGFNRLSFCDCSDYFRLER